MSRLFFTIITICFISFPLASCGFHLRGPETLAPPLHRIYVKIGDPYGQLAKNIKQSLLLSQVEITSSPESATTVLDIVSEKTGQQLLGVGGTQQTRQYKLTLTVTFQVTDSKGSVLVPLQQVAEWRTISIQASQVLGGSNEANSLYQQMRQAIVFDIMTLLGSQNTAHALQNIPSHS
jgi:LPS-assembly lipoprotein